MAFFGVIEKYILGGRWSCIGRHKLPDGAKRGGGTTKIQKQIIPSQPKQKLPDRVKGVDLLQKIKYNITSQPLHKLLMMCRGE